ncbi:YcxB family protein [Ferruginibacter sp.]
MITLNYKLTKEDYISFFLQVAWLSPEKKTRLIKSYVYRAIVFTAMLFFVKIFSPQKNFDLYFFYSILIVILIIISPLFKMADIYRKQVNQLSENPLNANFFSDIQINIAETGIFSKNQFAETRYQWEGIVKKEENKEYYFLYLSTEQAILIPKRALKSELEKQQVEKLFGEHISFNAEVGHLVKG